MAKLSCLLALAQATLIYGLPAPEVDREAKILNDREIVLLSGTNITTSYSSVVLSSLQSASVTLSPSITATFLTGLPSGGPTQNPLPTLSISDVGPLEPIDSTLAPGITNPVRKVSSNIFVAMETGAPLRNIVSRNDHPVQKRNIVDGDVPIETNKFYANFFLGSQTNSVWTLPYALTWAKGRGNSYGMAVTHTERRRLAWDKAHPPQYFMGPIGLQNIVFSAAELGQDTFLSTEKLKGFSVYANLAPSRGQVPIITLPCVQGMGLVTALYNGATPLLTSGTLFRTLKYVGRINGVTFKYQIRLEDGSRWLLYATPYGALGAPPFRLQSSTTINGPRGFVGVIQVGKKPVASEAAYDAAAGAYALTATVSGSVDGSTGSYTIAWKKGGVQNQTLLMYTLPHHVKSFDARTHAALAGMSLVTTTKGYARAVLADSITMIERNLPNTMGFEPWVPITNGGGGGGGGGSGFSNDMLNTQAIAAINSAGAIELAQDFDAQTRLDSMYYSGKGLSKFAGAIYTVQTMARNTKLAAAGLVKLKDAFNVFVNNTQPLPLIYDNVWKGLVSSGTYLNGDTGIDFGNTLYNDHHFHYGYFVWTAAVIGYLDPSWLEAGHNKAWVNALVRDYANPSGADPHFPFQRSFDWFHGHSWAKGLFESADGKDQESSSEDTFSTYALKMWGHVSGDANMEARGNLQLAVQARSLKKYFLLQRNNKVQPKRFLPNKVTGILFENKIDHTTYFGTNIEYIQGIHMIPLAPSSAYTRPRQFVQEEWDRYFSHGRVDSVQGGWKSILYANLALIDPVTSYNFFADPAFDLGELDGGASHTWYLAFSAAMAGGSRQKVLKVVELPMSGIFANTTAAAAATTTNTTVPTNSTIDTPDPDPDQDTDDNGDWDWDDEDDWNSEWDDWLIPDEEDECEDGWGSACDDWWDSEEETWSEWEDGQDAPESDSEGGVDDPYLSPEEDPPEHDGDGVINNGRVSDDDDDDDDDDGDGDYIYVEYVDPNNCLNGGGV